MKRLKTSTRKRRNTALELLMFKNSDKFNAVREEFTVFKTLEKDIGSLPDETSGGEIFNKAALDYLSTINTPTGEVTKDMPMFLNHGSNHQNNFYVFEEKHADKIVYWQAVLVVSICICMLLGALIISWKIN